MTGQTIAHYKVTAKLGQGGMGEVYRATDTKLGRDVAIKVLPESLAGDPERLARFEREAKLLASLNHPCIAAIYGFEKHDDRPFLVLELVEGEDLSARLKREPLSVEEALEVGKQVAEALEAAHEKGVIHRDLKPGNIKFTGEGRVKVLDFGLAKALEERTPSSSTDVTTADSPTITEHFTRPGVVLGTAAYMSPEQARGKVVDKRSDIWSFGSVLYECLTGKRAFPGEDTTDILATIIKGDPDWGVLPANTPATIQLLLRKCLAKDRKRRLQDIGDARIDLEQAIADPSSSFIRLSEGALKETRARSSMARTVAIGIAVVAAAGLGWLLKPVPVPEALPVRRLSVDLGVERSLLLDRGNAVRLSPDGSSVAFIVASDTRRQLYVRRLDDLAAMPAPIAEGVDAFCYSPHGQWIAFISAGRSVKVVPATGGTARLICDFLRPRGLDWGDNDVIVMGSYGRGIYRVPSQGGTPEPVTTLGEGEKTHRLPQLLPGGQAVLYTAHNATDDFDKANIMVQRLPSGEPELVWAGGYCARYLPTGHLVFINQGTLFAAAFDLISLKLHGQPVPVLEEVATRKGSADSHFDVSPEGSLVYVRGALGEELDRLEWVDREGNRQLLLPGGKYGDFKLSPDGRLLAYELSDGNQSDIYIHNVVRNTPERRLTFSSTDDSHPVWSPSGESIVFSSERDGVANLYWRRADGDGETRRLTESTNRQLPWSWHPQGQQLAILEIAVASEDNPDIRIVNLEGDDRTGWRSVGTTNFLATTFVEVQASFSPDGRWLAYASNESGEMQVWVRAFPEGPSTRVSVEGRAHIPMWSPVGPELVFGGRSGVDRLSEVFVAGYAIQEGTLNPDRPTRWEGGTYYHAPFTQSFDLHPDGRRLLVRKRAKEDAEQLPDRIVLFENFFEYLRQQVPSGKK